MARVLFTNVRIIDGCDPAPFVGEVLVEGEKIAAVARDGRVKRAGAEVVDGGGRTLMPGLVEGHAHLSFIGFQDLYASAPLPVEEPLPATLGAARLVPHHRLPHRFEAA